VCRRCPTADRRPEPTDRGGAGVHAVPLPVEDVVPRAPDELRAGGRDVEIHVVNLVTNALRHNRPVIASG
jgi:hypothetical protein